MTDRFDMNGVTWAVRLVAPDDPALVDRTGALTVATTDPETLEVCVSRSLRGEFLTRVLVHELGHCALFSYGLVGELRRMVRPAYWEYAEEWVCNFLADYGTMVLETAWDVLGEEAVPVVANEIGRLVA